MRAQKGGKIRIVNGVGSFVLVDYCVSFDDRENDKKTDKETLAIC